MELDPRPRLLEWRESVGGALVSFNYEDFVKNINISMTIHFLDNICKVEKIR